MHDNKFNFIVTVIVMTSSGRQTITWIDDESSQRCMYVYPGIMS